MLILAHCADKAGALTLQDVLQAACGKTGLISCSVLVALYCFGTCVTFLIIIGDQFDRGKFLFHHFFLLSYLVKETFFKIIFMLCMSIDKKLIFNLCNPVFCFFFLVLLSVWGKDFCHLWYLDRSFTMTISSVIFILPLCYSKRIDFLRYVR